QVGPSAPVRIEKDNRHSDVWPESPIDEFCSADIDAGGGRIPPHDARASLRLFGRAHTALHKYRGRISWHCAALNRQWSDIPAQAKRRALTTPSAQTQFISR